MSKTIAKARNLRHNQTPAERCVWDHIRNNALGVKFRRQLPVGRYIADFACLELKLIVEVDGAEHAESKRDAVRTRYLESLGFQVLRYWNNEAVGNIDGVIADLNTAIAARKI